MITGADIQLPSHSRREPLVQLKKLELKKSWYRLGRTTNPRFRWKTVETVAADSRGLFMRNFFFVCSGVITVSEQGGWGRLGC
jgi:hypothetical protein